MCGPHGLKFLKPVELRLPHCASMTPDGWSFALKSSDSSSGTLSSLCPLGALGAVVDRPWAKGAPRAVRQTSVSRPVSSRAPPVFWSCSAARPLQRNRERRRQTFVF